MNEQDLYENTRYIFLDLDMDSTWEYVSNNDEFFQSLSESDLAKCKEFWVQFENDFFSVI